MPDELDRLVAIHVMGAKPSEASDPYWLHFPEAGPFTGCDCEGHSAAQRCPAYSTDIAAAWQVVEKFGTFITIERETTAWLVQLGGEGVASHDSVTMAICLAALKAVGVEPPSA